MWTTAEDSIDTSRMVNPKLVKFSLGEIITNIPEQFKNFSLNNPDDVRFIVATCDEPLRAFALLLKLSTRNEVKRGEVIAPFSLYDRGLCRRIMLKFTDKKLSKDSIQFFIIHCVEFASYTSLVKCENIII